MITLSTVLSACQFYSILLFPSTAMAFVYVASMGGVNGKEKNSSNKKVAKIGSNTEIHTIFLVSFLECFKKLDSFIFLL